MEKLSSDDLALIDELFKTVFRDIITEEQKIKDEHPEEWAEYVNIYNEFDALMLNIVKKDPGFISRRYYGKRKAGAVSNGKVYPETETD